jgi:WD40 repeat protein
VLAREHAPAASLAASEDGTELAAAFGSKLVVWTLRGGRAGRRTIPAEGVLKVALAADGKTLAAGTEAGGAVVTRLPEGDVRTLPPRDPGAQESVIGIALSHDGRTLAASLHDGEVLLGGTSRLGRPLPPGGQQEPLALDVALSPDDDTVAAGREDGSIALWDTRDRRRVRVLRPAKQAAALSVAFAPDGRVLAVANATTAPTLWDVDSGRPSGLPFQARVPVRAVRFSSRGTLAAAGAADGKVVIFDVASREPLGKPLTGHAGAVYAVAFVSNGTRLASAGADGRVLLWDIRPWADEEALRERVCGLVGRNLTRSEWAKYVPGKRYRRTCDEWPAAG